MKIKSFLITLITMFVLIASTASPAVTLSIVSPSYKGKNLVCPTGYTFYSVYKGNYTGYRTYYNKCIKVIR